MFTLQFCGWPCVIELSSNAHIVVYGCMGARGMFGLSKIHFDTFVHACQKAKNTTKFIESDTLVIVLLNNFVKFICHG